MLKCPFKPSLLPPGDWERVSAPPGEHDLVSPSLLVLTGDMDDRRGPRASGLSGL